MYRRGLGYYRVPKTMVTELNGDRIPHGNIQVDSHKILFPLLIQSLLLEETMETVLGTMIGWLTSAEASTIV